MPTYQTATTRRTPRPLTGADAGVIATLAGALALLGAPLTYLAATLVDRLVHHWLGGPGTASVTRWLLAGTLGLALGLAILVWWLLGDRMERLVVATEEGGAPPPPTPASVVEWQMPTGPNSISRGRLLCSPELLVSWARAATHEQSLSYATWAARFGGARQYAAFLTSVVGSSLGTQSGGRGELRLSRKGFALFGQIAQLDDSRTPLLADLPLLQDRNSE